MFSISKGIKTLNVKGFIIMRTRANTSNIKKVEFFGIPVVVSPITPEEFKLAKFNMAKATKNYVQDSSLLNPFQKAVVFSKTQHLIINGETGTGKDEFVVNLAATKNVPFAQFNFNTNGDASGWINRLTFDEKNGATVTEENAGMLRHASQGITIKRDLSKLVEGGEDISIQEIKSEMEDEGWTVSIDSKNVATISIPAIILISDYDRAGYEQLEALRQAVELGKEMLTCPITGEMFRVLENTRFIFTSNSGVDGDGGRGMNYQAKDTSMSNRMSAIYIPHPSVKFEESILQASFPERTSEEIETLVNCTRALRKAVREEYLALDCSIRQGLAWLGHIERFEQQFGIPFNQAALETLDAFTGHCFNKDTRSLLETTVKVFLEVKDPNEQPTVDDGSKCPIDL